MKDIEIRELFRNTDAYAGKEVTISFTCKDGGDNNQDGDWMMIKYPVIE